MSAIPDSLIEITHDDASNILSVKWADGLSVESPLFPQTLVPLFAFIHEQKIREIIIAPCGGVLSEEVINSFIQNIPGITLKHIAILESADYLWDNNLYQVLSMLATNFELPIEVRLLKNSEAALRWFHQAKLAHTKPAKP